MAKSHRDPRLSTREQLTVYTVVGALWLSGILWWVARLRWRVAGELGASPHWSEPWSQKIHGALGMGFLLVLGFLIHRHLIPGWESGRSRLSGISIVAICAILIVTGWALYYVGGESLRQGSALVHRWIGLGLPVFLLGHVLIGKLRR